MFTKLIKFLIFIPLAITLVFIFNKKLVAAVPDYNMRIYYLYEVGNQIPLADFELGSAESIKDKSGSGLGLSFVIKSGKKLLLELDLGYSSTLYQGLVEDGVSITFIPQAGQGYDTISSSKNVTYDFDLAFQNPYAGLNIVFNNFRIGGGQIFQKSKGGVTLYTSDIKIVEATYETRTQLYWQAGFDLDMDGLYFSAFIRSFEAPELTIIDCNEKALGVLACQRIRGATGNRNLRTTNFGGGVLQFGFIF